MQLRKPLKLVHEDLKQSLHKWRRAQESFESKYSWTTERRLVPENTTSRIEDAANRIQWRIRQLLDFAYASAVVTTCLLNEETSKDFVLGHVNQIQHASKEMADALYDELDSILYYCDDATVFLSWQAVCAGVNSFAQSASHELTDFLSKHPGAFDGALTNAVRSLEETANAAIECRKKGITVHYKGPLCEYALEDAKSLRALIHTDIRDHKD
jgi:hypothetical protein